MSGAESAVFVSIQKQLAAMDGTVMR